MSNTHRILNFTSVQLLFTILLFALGLFCFGIAAQDYLNGHSILSTSSKALNEAILTCLVLVGFSSLGYGFIKLRSIIDKRFNNSDRRKNQESIEFVNRRTGVNRRNPPGDINYADDHESECKLSVVNNQ